MADRVTRRYRKLPYTRRVERREDEPGNVYFIARVVEIPHLRIDGATPEEALLKLDEIFDDVIVAMVKAGDEVPEPELWPASLGYVQPATAPTVPRRPVIETGREPDPWSPARDEAQLVSA